MFRRILVPLDRSKRAERALSSAAQVARASGGSAAHLSAALSAPAQGALHLARVLRLPTYYEYGQMDSVARARQQATSDANAYLHTVEQRLRQGDLAHLNVLVSLSVAVNTDVAQTLISMAEIGEDREDVENVFIDFWNAHGGRGLPRLPDRGTRDWNPRINVYRNDPHMLIFPIRTAYLEAIDRAQRHIYLTHAYFIPDRMILRGLLTAAARGVDVRILLPATSNHTVANWLARGYYTQCLTSGIHLLLYQHAMMHAKTATIDGIWSPVGTANLDRLSLVGNFEVNVEFYDEALAQQMEDIFSRDASNTRELTLEEWQRRPLLERFAETMLLPLRPFL